MNLFGRLKLAIKRLEMCPHHVCGNKMGRRSRPTSCCEMIWITRNRLPTPSPPFHFLWRLGPPTWAHATISNFALNKMHIDCNFHFQIFKSVLNSQDPTLLFKKNFHLCPKIRRISQGAALYKYSSLSHMWSICGWIWSTWTKSNKWQNLIRPNI